MIKTFTKDQKGLALGRNWTVGELWLDDSTLTLVIDDVLVGLMDKFTDKFGKKPKFKSKKSIYCYDGHTSGSYHYKGMAADLYVDGATPIQLAQYAEALGAGGIGVYEGWDQAGRHIHMDTRTGRACWWVVTSNSHTPGFASTDVYKKGDRSPYIILVQRKLGGLTEDGNFGAKTETAVKSFQKANLLTADGIVGPKTSAALGL